MTVQQMIDALSKMPKDALLKIEVSAYYWTGDNFEAVDEPSLNNDGTVTIGSVDASP